MKRRAGTKSCFAVHSSQVALQRPRLPRKLRGLNACRVGNFAGRRAQPRSSLSLMSDRSAASGSGNVEPAIADIDAATRRLMAALDALEGAVERRREADRDENELASRIQALGADRSRLARTGLSGASDLLDELESTARDQPRDAFGRLADDEGDRRQAD